MPDSQLAPRAGFGGLFALIATMLLAAVLSLALVWSEFAVGYPSFSWTMFGVIAGLLVICEGTPRTWISLDRIDTVTLLPMYAYALLLLGSPSSALGVAILGNLVHSATRQQPPWVWLLHLSRTMVSVATGGLVLFAMSVRGPVTQFEKIPWRWALAIVLAGVAILVLDTVITEVSASMRRRVSFVASLRRGLALRLTAVGSLLSLAPIWVIGIDSSVVLVPLLGITTILVFTSTRRALERAQEAHHDPLTGLANRRSFSEHLGDVYGGVGAPAGGALLLMDLDGFKEVNDHLGHDVGDAVLVQFADRLTSSLPLNAYAGRLGGDEFAALVTWTKRHDDVDSMVQNLHARLTQPLIVQGFPVSVGVSIGVALVREVGRSGAELLHAADVAMYRAKRLATGVEHYHDDIGAIQTGRLGLLGDLGAAVRDNELRVDYQPQLSMTDGHVVAVEALVRWQHPKHGTIAPNDFIGLAEQTDLIGPITEMVLRMATSGLLELGAKDVRLAVNTSVRNLQDRHFSQNVLAVLAETGFPADRLELEVTERSLITNAHQTRDTIADLHAAGIRITVDGFGTGYASYQTLRLLKIDRVKIDLEFVLRLMQDPQDRAIVRSVISLAHELGLEVVAEGVEANETWDTLGAMGCDAAQGFWIATPMSLTSLWVWMREWQRISLSGDPACGASVDNAP